MLIVNQAVRIFSDVKQESSDCETDWGPNMPLDC